MRVAIAFLVLLVNVCCVARDATLIRRADPPTATLLSTRSSSQVIVLPTPRFVGTVSLEETLAKRRSVREFSNEALTFAEIGQLLWAAQGVLPAQRLDAEMQKTGSRVRSYQLDVVDPARTLVLAQQIESEFGPVDVLVPVSGAGPNTARVTAELPNIRN